MSKLLAKLTFVLTVTAAVGFYYLAAAPPTLAQVNVCGAGNFSDACPTDGQTVTSTSSQPIDVYTGPVTQKVTSVPEPSTVIALLITGCGIICSGRKRKDISEER